MANISNVRMGACSLTFNGVDCGHTLGGVKLTNTRKLTDLKVDKYGDSVIDKVLTANDLVISCKVAEPVISLIKVAMPEGTYLTGTAGTQLGIAAGEGASMRASAAVLTLHPFARSATDYTEDVTIYLAVPTANPVLNYDTNGQRVFDLEFSALVSEAYTPGRRLGHIGPVNIS